MFTWFLDGLSRKIQDSQKIRRPLLIAFSLVMTLILFAVLSFSFTSTQKIFSKNIEAETQEIFGFFDTELQSQASMQELLVYSLAERTDIQQRFLDADQSFDDLADDYYEHINDLHKITHLYFIRPDKTVIYRGHSPQRKNDLITRQTLADASKLKQIVSGLEFGVLGTFTLRSVSPVWHNNRLVGFVEAGMEIGHIIELTESQFHTSILDIFDKKRMSRSSRQEVFKLTGRNTNDDLLPNRVIQYSDASILDKVDMQAIAPLTRVADQVSVQGHIHGNLAISTRSVYDYQQNLIGKQLIFIDITEHLQIRATELMLIFSTILVGFVLCLYFFHRVLGQVETVLSDYVQEQIAQKRIIEENMLELQHTQQTLLQKEKMASLGNIVAGVAHEINTPLGISVTMGSTLQQSVNECIEKLNQAQLRRSDLARFETETKEAFDIMLPALTKAADLISSFKDVAVNQTSEQRREFKLDVIIKEVLATLNHKLKYTNHRYKLELEPDIVMDSYPGPLGQVISNLFDNALLHGFENRNSGEIVISTQLKGDKLSLKVADDGKGIAKAELEKVFDPFYTTKLGQGGSGLGLNIIFNIVQQVLGGTISVDSEVDGGTVFSIEIPTLAPDRKET